MLYYFGKAILSLFGWNTNIRFPFDLKKYILIVGPHTSNWDFVVLLGYRSVVGINRTRFLGKKELFKPPFGFIFRWLGGVPVDRKNKSNMVDEVAALFHTHEEFSIALSPEGTRKKVDKIRTGFYFIARAASVPIIMIGLDYANRQLVFSDPLYTTDDQQKDFEKIFHFYRPIQGKFPENGLGHF